jgi:hypothetical protein
MKPNRQPKKIFAKNFAKEGIGVAAANMNLLRAFCAQVSTFDQRRK